ncbi:HET-domain-containing protein [Zopfia rhizophila CBS 207.26]|uniref:HET-domain-containing protein n=1 Tax=Zopfia rhizophila CBS 207.26 TaxID=1314779 RepID=A0A6A6DJ83_9PEZI|nr:HET-domain-containing protein [Zopfia rhizophila CBS 207.26]
MAADWNINLSKVSAAKNDCQVCALLLRTAKRHCNNDEQNVQIDRERSALKIRSGGPPILRLCSDSAALPTRLVFVGDPDRDVLPDPDVLSLYSPKESDNVEYVALSHCWGKLPKNVKPRFCTTDDNIKARFEEFVFSELPKTFQDAVRITRELGIQYLWIDSLCIIQGNQKDWEHEAKRMEDVFASAYCTIAATSAVDSKAGFLERNVRGEYVYAQDASGRRFYVCTDIDDFDNDVKKARLNTRAWVMQERVLSRRTIHFSANQTYFECGKGVYCENLTRLKSSSGKTYFMLDPNFPDRLFTSGNKRTREFIHSISEEYSRYGIFQTYLHRNLLWQASGNKMERIVYENRHVPSWSWMAYYGGIQFMKIPFDTVDWIANLQFDEECKLALFTKVGEFRNCMIQPDRKNYALLYSGKKEKGWIQYDVEKGEDLCKERCVVVGRKSNKYGDGLDVKEYYILVVRPTGVDGEYSRVGVGLIQSDYVVRQEPNVRVV